MFDICVGILITPHTSMKESTNCLYSVEMTLLIKRLKPILV